MTLNTEVQNDSVPKKGSSLLPKITNFGSISFSALKQIKRRPPVIIPEEFLRRSARIKERKDKLRNQNSNPHHAPGSTTNVCVQNKTANTQSATVFWRTVEQSPNLPLVSAPRNESIKEKEPEKVVGLVTKDDTLYVLVKWRNIDAPEYVDKRKSSAEILELLNEFLNPDTCSVGKQNVKREDVPDEEVFRYRQHVAMGEISQSSENENVSLNIKIE